MSAPTLSVILPNFNHAEFLPRALKALMEQSLPAGEIILVDDGSTDHSRKIIEDAARSCRGVRPIYLEKNQGTIAAMARGLTEARGDFAYFASADDPVLPCFFEKSMNLLGSHPRAGLCCSDYFIHHESDERRYQRGLLLDGPPRFISPDDLARLLGEHENFIIPSSTVILRRDALLSMGGFQPQLQWHCDWFAYSSIALRNGFCYVPEPLTLFRLASASYSGAGAQKSRERRELARHFLTLAGSPEFKDIRKHFRRPALLSFARDARWLVFKESMKNPSYWGFPSWELLKACLRDQFRRSLWDFLWTILSPLSSRNFNKLKLRSLRLFGARISGTPQIQPYAHFESPWNLVLHDKVVISRGARFWGTERIEIESGTIIEREAVVSSSCWDVKNKPPVWRNQSIHVGKNALVGVRALVMPGAQIQEDETVPPMTVRRGVDVD